MRLKFKNNRYFCVILSILISIFSASSFAQNINQNQNTDQNINQNISQRMTLGLEPYSDSNLDQNNNQAFGQNNNEQLLQNFYTIDDASNSKQSPFLQMAPQNMMNQFFRTPMATGMSLLKWLLHDGDPGEPAERYNRSQHFGSWINDPEDGVCYNTRAKVLIRDSEIPVTFRGNSKCIVDSGRWADPYTGTVKTLAKDIQIDHVVPLKEAYLAGAWKWPKAKRCLYANFMNNTFHLMSVDGHENMSKSDETPADYMPPNTQFACNYLEDWLKIKLIWNLRLSPREGESIKSYVEHYGCDIQAMKINRGELSKQRLAAQSQESACEKSTAETLE